MLKKLFSSSALTAVLLISGCASFPQNEIPSVSAMPDVSKYQNKPSVFVDVHFYVGSPNGGATENTAAAGSITPSVEKAVSESHLFSKYTFSTLEKDKVDYTIKINVYNDGNQVLAFISGYITGFTLGVVPGMATENLTLKTQLIGKNGAIVKESSNKDSVDTWFGLWFIPMMDKKPQLAMAHTIENQVKDQLKTLVDQGALQYSMNDMSTSFN